MASTSDRGYGTDHQHIRKALIGEAYGTDCHFCGHPMLPGQSLDLDHTGDRTGYRGFAHASCNRRDGAKRGNAKRRRSKRLKTSEPW